MPDKEPAPTAVQFIVRGDPQGKGRPRAVRTKSSVRMFTPHKTELYERLIATMARHAMAGRAPFVGPVNLLLAVRHAPPGSWSRRKRADALAGMIPCVLKPDLDNVAKAIADAGNGILWDDDRQIVTLQVDRSWSDVASVLVHVSMR